MFSAFAALHPAAQAQEPPINAEVEVGYQPGLAPGDQIEILAPDLTSNERPQADDWPCRFY